MTASALDERYMARALFEPGLGYYMNDARKFGAAGDFVAANPRAEVPALIHDGVGVFDSTIILEYLEDKWPSPALLPREPAARARARMLEDAMDTHYEKPLQ